MLLRASRRRRAQTAAARFMPSEASLRRRPGASGRPLPAARWVADAHVGRTEPRTPSSSGSSRNAATTGYPSSPPVQKASARCIQWACGRAGRFHVAAERPGRIAPPAGRRRVPVLPRPIAQPGDAIIFHCLTPHAALPNRGSALRISGDFRWQRVGQPAPAELVLGPAARPPELFARLFRREPWWEPVPAGLELHPRAQLVSIPPGPSRLVAVHPGWRHWRPPPAVH